ncbi:MAG: hypothetical protein UR12_C0004G0002 [candidate division TM6 bacterium GW2011_GWF2_30_66]|nr:MAG: hypothetical protein UR12_C0004G0002 [candidate division TM6 bacterium GW2011_GWF2_30_66]
MRLIIVKKTFIAINKQNTSIFFLIALYSCQIFGFNYLIATHTLKKIPSPKIIVLAGHSVTGKGTFGKFLPEVSNLYIHVDLGEMVRREIREKTKIGKEIQPIYESGQYLDGTLDKIVWDKLICKKLEDTLGQNKTPIIDGFLRSKLCFDLLHKFITDQKINNNSLLIQLIANEQVCTKRILTRRVCTNTKCSKIYNTLLPEYELLQNSKNSKNLTDVHDKTINKLCLCGAELSNRSNNTKKFAQERRKHFDKEIEPLLAFAKNWYKYAKINTKINIYSLNII